jgi:hypothetical protein
MTAPSTALVMVKLPATVGLGSATAPRSLASAEAAHYGIVVHVVRPRFSPRVDLHQIINTLHGVVVQANHEKTG